MTAGAGGRRGSERGAAGERSGAAASAERVKTVSCWARTIERVRGLFELRTSRALIGPKRRSTLYSRGRCRDLRLGLDEVVRVAAAEGLETASSRARNEAATGGLCSRSCTDDLVGGRRRSWSWSCLSRTEGGTGVVSGATTNLALTNWSSQVDRAPRAQLPESQTAHIPTC